jgi:hypothetical protein
MKNQKTVCFNLEAYSELAGRNGNLQIAQTMIDSFQIINKQ